MLAKSTLALALFAGSLFVAVSASADETITYTYDARGRLIKVVHTGDVNDDVQTTYEHDDADNRTSVTTTGVPE